MFLSFCIIFLSCSFHVPLILHRPLMFLSFSYHGIHVPSFSVAMYQTYKSSTSKGDIFKLSAQTLAFSSYVVIVFVIVLLSFWRPVQVAIFRVHEHVHV